VYMTDKPRVVACVRLGADAPKARSLFDEILNGDGSVRKRTYHGHEISIVDVDQQQTLAKDVFVFATDTNMMDAVLERIDTGGSLEETFKPPVFEVGQRIGWAVVDIAAVLQKVRASIKEAADTSRFDAVVKELGAEQVQRFEIAAGFDGPAIRTAVRISGLSPASRLFALYGNHQPLDDAALRLIPKDVAAGSAAHIDVAALWDTIMRVIELAAGHDGYQQAQDAITTFETNTQVHVKTDLVDAAGDVIVFYSKPGPMPMAGGELAMILALKDPQTFSRGIDRLLDYASKQLATNQSSRQAMSLSIQRSKVGDVNVSYLAGVPMLSPAFAVKGQHAFLAISPMALNAAIAQVDDPSSSLLDNPIIGPRERSSRRKSP